MIDKEERCKREKGGRRKSEKKDEEETTKSLDQRRGPLRSFVTVFLRDVPWRIEERSADLSPFAGGGADAGGGAAGGGGGGALGEGDAGPGEEGGGVF